jgi:hypothetical protein
MRGAILALGFVLAAGSAYAACTTADLSGRWDLQVGHGHSCRFSVGVNGDITSGKCESLLSVGERPVWKGLLIQSGKLWFANAPTCQIAGKITLAPERVGDDTMATTVEVLKGTMALHKVTAHGITKETRTEKRVGHLPSTQHFVRTFSLVKF